MTVTNTGFPIGYFYIISQLNGLVLGIRGDQETATVLYDRHSCNNGIFNLFINTTGRQQDCHGRKKARIS